MGSLMGSWERKRTSVEVVVKFEKVRSLVNSIKIMSIF